jgi:DNA-binding transcriptional regulator GbsR (MarR family)
MSDDLTQIKQNFVEGLSGISQFWGFPKGMGAIFAVLYLSPNPLSLDEIVEQAGLTKGAISTNVRALSRMGLIHPVTRLGDRKDYYEAETDFYKAIRAILKERQNSEFDRAVASVRTTLQKLEAVPSTTLTSEGQADAERAFLTERVRALNSFFDALDALNTAVARLDSLGLNTVQTVLKILR